jgi:hypothetical protein
MIKTVALTLVLALQPMAWNHKGLAVVRSDGSIYLPQDAAEELMAHLEWAEQAPALCEEEKTAERDILIKELSQTTKELKEAEAHQMNASTPIAIGLFGLLVGIITGFIAGSQQK